MRKHWYKVSAATLFVLLFPFLMRILIRISTIILSTYNITPLITITNIDKMDFSDYVSIIIALISCICSGAIGYFTYKLSLSIRNHDLQQEAEQKTNIREKIVYEITSNCEIIQLCEKKVSNDYNRITLDALGLIYEVRSVLSEQEFTQLKDLYDMFSEYKFFGHLSPKNKTLWISKDGSVNTETILTSLMREAVNNDQN